MYHQGGYHHSQALQQLHELTTILQTGLEKQPVTSDENKKSLLDSVKELDKMAKELEVNALVEKRLNDTLQEDIMEARQTKNLEKILVPVQENYQRLKTEVSAAPNELQVYKVLKGNFDKINKAIKDGKESASGNNAADESEEEIISEEAVVRMKDPITKERITEPVKNIHCGHVYNKPSIYAYMKDNRERRYICQCPQPGCSNKRQLVEGDIADFPEFFETAVLER